MLRDTLVGLIEPMLSSAGAYPLSLCTERKQPSDDRPPCLENPRPKGAESTLTENAASPFHAEPRQQLRPDPTANRKRRFWRRQNRDTCGLARDEKRSLSCCATVVDSRSKL